MAIRLFNTQTRQKEDFNSIDEGKVRMYVCGVTVYDKSHIGHARCYVAFDVIYRHLLRSGYKVDYVRNFTDVDDKIIKRANEMGVETRALADVNIAAYHEDMDSLGCRRPTLEPRVTDHIEDIIALIQKIIANNHGYIGPDGTVYFSIDSFPKYGRLSGRNLEDMEAGASERVGQDPNKKNPMDFVLWKPSKEGEPSWESPWGAGRPGWHVECSAMSARHLGETFDIHGGGKDLVFPHHENEIAQSEAASGKTFVNYWMHNGFVNVDSEKMSKSLGNFFTIKDVLEIYHPEAIRTFLLSTHYRSPINYSNKNLEEATGRIEYMYESLQNIDDAIEMGGNEGENLFPDSDTVKQAIQSAMDDDFNAAAAVGHLFELFRVGNDYTKKKKKLAGRITTLKAIREVISWAGEILGILEGSPAQVLQEIRERDIRRLNLDVDAINDLIEQRTTARKDKNYDRADEIRQELAAMNVALMDGPQGTTWGLIRSQVSQ